MDETQDVLERTSIRKQAVLRISDCLIQSLQNRQNKCLFISSTIYKKSEIWGWDKKALFISKIFYTFMGLSVTFKCMYEKYNDQSIMYKKYNNLT